MNRYHDVLAKIGAGSAHPGGFSLTQKWAARLRLGPRSRVLDVGCGTGRTACYLAARFGCRVTGLDLHPLMIRKARRRARLEGVPVEFVEGDLLAPPFQDETFDWVVAESVTVFVPRQAAIEQYRRLLVPGGGVLDVEMAARHPLPSDAARAIEALYGVTELPSYREWEELYRNGGFSEVKILDARRLDLNQALRDEWNDPDRWAPRFTGTPDDPEVREVLEANTRLMDRHAKHLGYVALTARRSSIPASGGMPGRESPVGRSGAPRGNGLQSEEKPQPVKGEGQPPETIAATEKAQKSPG
ncbi:MAG: class I SAM-dependent methyltransferase [Kyrpidia sp.]|nr:class I SAM-dependent methyltransferase [Kyrpidia sp.]